MEGATRASWLMGLDVSPEYRVESFPYKARCWRAIRSRRSSSVMPALGLMERSDLALEASVVRWSQDWFSMKR